MGHYILKPGMVHSTILKGERTSVFGDGKGTIELNEAQAASFSNKILGPSEEAVPFGPRPAPAAPIVAEPVEVVINTTPVGEEPQTPALEESAEETSKETSSAVVDETAGGDAGEAEEPTPTKGKGK